MSSFFRAFRIYCILFIGVGIGAILINRLFFIQIQQHGLYRALGQGQYTFFDILRTHRGEVFLKNLDEYKEERIVPLARNKVIKSVVLNPREWDQEAQKGQIDDVLRTLGIQKESFQNALAQNKSSFMILKEDVTEREEMELRMIRLKGIYFRSSQKREYPEHELAAHLIGFVGHGPEKESGQYGVEAFYEDILGGREGQIADDGGVALPFLKRAHYLVPQKGVDLYLTIDYSVQYMAERLLRDAAKQFDAQGGAVIVMDPHIGKILAMANVPSFDPNSYRDVRNLQRFLNPAVEHQFEPGSVFKPFVMAIAIEKKRVSPTTPFYDSGIVEIGGYVIKNFEDRVWGPQTATGILERSINTGMVFIGRLLEKKEMIAYFEKIGFGESTGVDLPGEIKGDFSNLKTMRDINFATASFGQGIALTPIQLASAFSVFANGGHKIQPYVVDKKVYPDGSVKFHTPLRGEKVFSKETIAIMNSMLINVIEQGTGKRARIKGYSVGGKTGTAQIPNLRGGGYDDDTIHTFVGYAPASDPKFIILVKLDKPNGVRAAEGSVVPIFRELMEYLFAYYEIPPDQAQTYSSGGGE